MMDDKSQHKHEKVKAYLGRQFDTWSYLAFSPASMFVYMYMYTYICLCVYIK